MPKPSRTLHPIEFMTCAQFKLAAWQTAYHELDGHMRRSQLKIFARMAAVLAEMQWDAYHGHEPGSSGQLLLIAEMKR